MLAGVDSLAPWSHAKKLDSDVVALRQTKEVGAFGAHGGIESLKLGWNAGLSARVMTESWTYSQERLQSVETNLKLRVEYFYCTGFAASCTTNNGNMMGQKGQDALGATAAWNPAQEFSYDNVSRLQMARERADAGGGVGVTHDGTPYHLSGGRDHGCCSR